MCNASRSSAIPLIPRSPATRDALNTRPLLIRVSRRDSVRASPSVSPAINNGAYPLPALRIALSRSTTAGASDSCFKSPTVCSTS